MNDFSPFILSDNDWQRLAKLVSLPEAARESLEYILGAGRFFYGRVSSTPPSHALRKSLADVAEKSSELVKALRRCAEDVDVAAALVEPRTEWASAPAPRLAAHRTLEKHIEMIELLTNWFKAAKNRVSASKKGNKTSAIHELVKDVDWLLCAHTSKGLVRGDNSRMEFLAGCLTLLEIDVTAEAMIRSFTKKPKGKVSSENN